SNPQGEEAPAPKLWANPPRIVDVEFRVQCDSFVCNLHKGPNLSGIDPATRAVVQLYKPRTNRWHEHFRWAGARIVGTTPAGRATVVVLEMNHPSRIAARANQSKAGRFD
ncbi:MAG TPA: hypothetical protein VN541_21970, partial [Tepidisphaeraceae bacterium]|nr:hypothetical protein [Tepidisphaeraceae bacterium]